MTYAKAVVAAVLAGLAALGTALADGHVTGVEWTIVAAAALTALGTVWGIPNKTAAPSAPEVPYRDV